MKLYMINEEGKLEEQPAPQATVFNLDDVRKAAEKAADLWIEQMQQPFNKDNGDDSPALFMLATMATQGSQRSLSPTALALFKTELISNIVAQFAQRPTMETLVLYCDYHPDQMLADAAQMAGINGGVFPWKSAVRIYMANNEIEYSFGYGKPHQVLKIS